MAIATTIVIFFAIDNHGIKTYNKIIKSFGGRI